MPFRDGQSGHSSRAGLHRGDSGPAGSKFNKELIALVIVLSVIAAAYAFLFSNAGWLLFADKDTAKDLTRRAQGNIRRDRGILVVQSTEGSISGVPLGPQKLAAQSLYLIEVRVEPGAGFVLAGRYPSTTRPIVFKYEPRGALRTELRLLGTGEAANRIRFRLKFIGPGDLRIESLKIYRMLPAHQRLVVTLRALMILLPIVFCLRYRRRLARSLQMPEPAVDALFTLVVFACCFWAFYRADVQQVVDSRYTTVVSHSLLRTGSLAVPENFEPATRTRKPYQLRRVGGSYYHFFSSAPAVLNTPFVGAFELFGVAPIAPSGAFLPENERQILKFTAALLAALLCACLYALARLYLAPIYALPLALVFAFGTQIFSTMSRPYWSHTWAVLLTTAALYLVLRPQRNAARAWELTAAATLVAWSFFCRPTMSLSVVGLSVLVALRQQRRLGVFIGAGLVWAALFVVYSLSVYDSVLPPYFGASHVAAGRFGRWVLRNTYPHAVLGTLVSPARGLFIYVPFFGWILWAVISRWRSLEAKAVVVTALAVIIAHWQLVCSFRNWWGGRSFGPRLFSDILPWFFVLGVLALGSLVLEPRRESRRWKIARVSVVSVLVAASLFINYRGATARATIGWNSWDRPPASKTSLKPPFLWNWRYPQFLAGLLPVEREKP